MLDAERGLHGLGILRANRKPAARCFEYGCGKARCAKSILPVGTAEQFAARDPPEHADAHDDGGDHGNEQRSHEVIGT